MRFAAQQKLHRPGIASASGLRAGIADVARITRANLERETPTVSHIRWLSNRRGLSLRLAPRRRTLAERPNFRPTLQALEDRWLPSTLTVLNNLDTGAGSLRAAIAAAPSGDTIVFAPSLIGQTITLTSGELLITHSLTIAGPGAGNLTISGNFASRVFEVGGNSGANVTLSGLTIRNGVAHDGLGGGAIENWGVLTVSNCTLTGNSASQGEGGAIANGGRTMTVSGCTLSGNSAAKGGAIVTHNAVTVINCTISGNTAAQGGGISDDSGTLTVDHCIVSGNTATSAGGGIYYTSGYGTVTIKNSSSITANTAPVGSGADVYNLGTLYLDSTSTIGILDGNPAVRI